MGTENKYETIIGLEVHAQLKTKSKIFCGCSTKFGQTPNSQTCPVCLGMPGVLPVLNERAVEFALMLGLATRSNISLNSIFARKNYFYPDLPKGYQITQYEQPLCENGFIDIEIGEEKKKIGIARIQLEEDAGKSIHHEDFVEQETFVDLNRCGVPLVEIVSYPQIRSPREAVAYLKELRRMLVYLNICDGNMAEGSLRCDANISIRKRGQQKFGNKTELKNMNSFRSVKRALEYERDRQIKIVDSGDQVSQDTLLWDETKNVAISMRSKEEAHDYRYFPEPDLIPLKMNQAQLDCLKKNLPELPLEKRDRFVSEYQLSKYEADTLTDNIIIANYFERIARKFHDYKLICNWLLGEVLHLMKAGEFDDQIPVKERDFIELLKLLQDGRINANTAKEMLNEIVRTGIAVHDLLKKQSMYQMSDHEKLKEIITSVIQANPDAVEKYKSGKTNIYDYFVGQVMRETGGRANPKAVNHILSKMLSDL